MSVAYLLAYSLKSDMYCEAILSAKRTGFAPIKFLKQQQQHHLLGI